jgi:hypothetical protein
LAHRLLLTFHQAEAEEEEEEEEEGTAAMESPGTIQDTNRSEGEAELRGENAELARSLALPAKVFPSSSSSSSSSSFVLLLPSSLLS